MSVLVPKQPRGFEGYCPLPTAVRPFAKRGRRTGWLQSHNWLAQKVLSFFRTTTSGRFFQVPLRLLHNLMRLNQRPLHEANFLLFVVLA
jgi:hypothetical protein